MPRATTKLELIQSANSNYSKLWSVIDSLSDFEQRSEFLFEDRDKNIRDVLIHLYEWHLLLLSWTTANLNGENKPFLPPPYNWRTYSDMNVEFWKKHQNTSYDDAKIALSGSCDKVMELADKFSDEELFEKKYFSWTGTSSLGSYFVSATSSHYDWAIKKIKRQIKLLKEKNI